MQLPAERASAYLRALRAGLQSLAPNEDYVPLVECDAHLAALDPALSGDVLLPAEIDPRAGLPAFGWLERAQAEQTVARALGPEGEHGDDVLVRAERVDPALGARLRARRDLHAFLRERALLPTSRLKAALRRTSGGRWDFSLRYDRVLPGAGWMRVRAELSGPERWSRGLFHLRFDGQVDIDEGVRHLLARHCVVPLLVLQEYLQDTLKVDVPRLSRSFVGPFWFPGVELPADRPPEVEKGLLLHLSFEVVAQDVRESTHRDPLLGAPIGEIPPPGHGLFRERRFAASPALVPTVEAWSLARGAQTVVAPILPLR